MGSPETNNKIPPPAGDGLKIDRCTTRQPGYPKKGPVVLRLKISPDLPLSNFLFSYYLD